MTIDTHDMNVVVEPVINSPVDAVEASDEASQDHMMSAQDIRHNMIVCVMLQALFYTGVADWAVALQPLLVYLKASNSMIGVISSAQCAGILGVFISPWISRKFRLKKWYAFLANIPALSMFGILGFGLLFSRQFGMSNPTLLMFVLVMMVCYWFFSGFCSLPSQEFVAACIPMSHRGRYTGYSFSISGITSIISASIGGLILLRVSKPAAFGYLFLMTWIICQSSYTLALMAREKASPVEKSPKPWSKAMLKAAWDDKPFIRYIYLSGAVAIFITPLFTFVNIYGFRELGMVPATAAIIQIVGLVVRIAISGVSGHITDKLTPKRVLPYWMLVAVLSLLPPIFMRNSYGVYISVALSTVYMMGGNAAWVALLYGLPSRENRAGHFTLQIIFSYYIATALGGLFIGKLCDMMPYRTVFVLGAIASLALFPIMKLALSIFSDKAEDYS